MIRPAIFTQLEQYAAAHFPPSAVAETNHTTHYSVVDPEGNAVATTTTLNDKLRFPGHRRGSGFSDER